MSKTRNFTYNERAGWSQRVRATSIRVSGMSAADGSEKVTVTAPEVRGSAPTSRAYSSLFFTFCDGVELVGTRWWSPAMQDTVSLGLSVDRMPLPLTSVRRND